MASGPLAVSSTVEEGSKYENDRVTSLESVPIHRKETVEKANK